ncbi:MAG: formylmethanofuran dehydrogenase subunit C [Methanospirillaceae archaeon]|nr:formylmethanofuran dehydrogenase subunit C [Methanospirillaceae archaeon]
MEITITFLPNDKPNIPVEAETIVPSAFIARDEIFVWEGNKKRSLSDIAEIEYKGSTDDVSDIHLVLLGETGRVKRVGEYMDGGRITIHGDIGMHCGNFMESGIIEITGNADAWLGREMRGGTIICHGSCGDYCGSGYRGEKRGMRGGTIEVMGDAQDFCGEYNSGGDIIIHGSCGDMAGVEMHAGTLTIHGDCYRPCGNLTGGTVTIHGTAFEMLPGFSHHGEVMVDGISYSRFTGDVANRGKGEVIVRGYQR